MYFPNPLGIAGGVDKNACHLRDWLSLGAGFVELGTVTPFPQKANRGKILDRSLEHFSLWNNMGFPNKGMEYVRQKLAVLQERELSAVQNSLSAHFLLGRKGEQSSSPLAGKPRSSFSIPIKSRLRDHSSFSLAGKPRVSRGDIAGAESPPLSFGKSFESASSGKSSESASSGKPSESDRSSFSSDKSSGLTHSSFDKPFESARPPIFINIGKNRETPLSQALDDYKKLMKCLYPFASAFVINISSPNTKGLRGLFDKKALPEFLKSLKDFAGGLKGPGKLEGGVDFAYPPGWKLYKELKGPADRLENRMDLEDSEGNNLNYELRGPAGKLENGVDSDREIPLILKLSPDEKDILRIIGQSVEAGIDGWCICNSTKERAVPGLFPERGGVSGRFLADRSLSLLKEVKKYLVDRRVKDKLLISCGGVLTAQDVQERLSAGADLVQVYSALVFEGPGFFHSVFRELSPQ